MFSENGNDFILHVLKVNGNRFDFVVVIVLESLGMKVFEGEHSELSGRRTSLEINFNLPDYFLDPSTEQSKTCSSASVDSQTHSSTLLATRTLPA